MVDCLLCHPAAADAAFDRVRLWEDDRWRLSAVLRGPIPGFAHLEPLRHIPFVTDLDGAEAATFGQVLARVTEALRVAADAERTYVYVVGDHVPHFHVTWPPTEPVTGCAAGRGCSIPTPPTRTWCPIRPSRKLLEPRSLCHKGTRQPAEDDPTMQPARPPHTEGGPVVLSGR